MSNVEIYASCRMALALKKAGFDDRCDHYYTREDAADGMLWLTGDGHDLNYNADAPERPCIVCSAPRLDQAQKWLREKKWLHIEIEYDLDGRWRYTVVPMEDCFASRLGAEYACYEYALADGIAAALEMLDK